jgi:hypothetical protein
LGVDRGALNYIRILRGISRRLTPKRLRVVGEIKEIEKWIFLGAIQRKTRRSDFQKPNRNELSFQVDATESENRKSASNIADIGGIAGALARALEERRKNMTNSDGKPVIISS